MEGAQGGGVRLFFNYGLDDSDHNIILNIFCKPITFNNAIKSCFYNTDLLSHVQYSIDKSILVSKNRV